MTTTLRPDEIEARACRAMLAALRERIAHSSVAPSLRGSGWDSYATTLDKMERAAIAAAEAAGIKL